MDQDSSIEPTEFFFEDDGIVPNSKLPLLYYSKVFSSRNDKEAEWLEHKFYFNN